MLIIFTKNLVKRKLLLPARNPLLHALLARGVYLEQCCHACSIIVGNLNSGEGYGLDFVDVRAILYYVIMFVCVVITRPFNVHRYTSSIYVRQIIK